MSGTPDEAILLVGGKGTRLRPLTLSTPKPLLPTAGVPFLAHQLARIRATGVRHVVFATSYRAEMFEPCFGDGGVFDLEIDYVTETSPLGTGGGIRSAAEYLRGGPDDPILVLNGDILSGHDIDAQLALHEKNNATVTLHLVEVDDPSRFGCVPTDAADRVTAFLEKTSDPATNRINAGCYVFRRSALDAIPPDRVVSVERETFPGLIAAGAPVLGYVQTAYWLDVGMPADYVRGSCDLVLGAMPSPALPGAPGPMLALDGARIADDARVSGGTTLGAGADAGAESVVDGSVLLDGASVAPRAVVRDSVLGHGARVAEGAVLDGAVLGDRAVIGAGNELRAGVRIWPDTTLPPGTVRFSSDV